MFWTSALPLQQMMTHELTFYAKFIVLDYSLYFTDYCIIAQRLIKLNCNKETKKEFSVLKEPL